MSSQSQKDDYINEGIRNDKGDGWAKNPDSKVK